MRYSKVAFCNITNTLGYLVDFDIRALIAFFAACECVNGMAFRGWCTPCS
jgi:hypothetical protein